MLVITVSNRSLDSMNMACQIPEQLTCWLKWLFWTAVLDLKSLFQERCTHSSKLEFVKVIYDINTNKTICIWKSSLGLRSTIVPLVTMMERKNDEENVYQTISYEEICFCEQDQLKLWTAVKPDPFYWATVLPSTLCSYHWEFKTVSFYSFAIFLTACFIDRHEWTRCLWFQD